MFLLLCYFFNIPFDTNTFLLFYTEEVTRVTPTVPCLSSVPVCILPGTESLALKSI